MPTVFRASAIAFFFWGILLGLAPLVTALLTWRETRDVWLIAGGAGVAACAVVTLFAVSAGRRL